MSFHVKFNLKFGLKELKLANRKVMVLDEVELKLFLYQVITLITQVITFCRMEIS